MKKIILLAFIVLLIVGKLQEKIILLFKLFVNVLMVKEKILTEDLYGKN